MNPLPSSIALALGVVGIAPAMAQSSGSEEASMMEEVTVTGVRRSLIDSAAIKRDADGVVDALSAEDIGKFPDTNLAEAMQRITGVSIDRGGPGGASGEGQRITVRGIGPDYNLVLLNGRQMPASSILDTAASTSRAFDFSNLAAEAVSGVDVYKTSMSNIPTGGIGATVNIRTARPLDVGDRTISVGAKGVYDQSAQDPKWTPEISGIYSDVFADGTFGITLTGIYQDRELGYNQAAATSGWRSFRGDEVNWGTIPLPGAPGSENITNRPGPDDIYSVPQNIFYGLNSVSRERINGQLTLQWRPVDSLTMTLDYTYSEMEVQTERSELSAWFNFGASESAWEDGPAAAPLLYREFYDGYPTDVGAGGAKFGTKNENNSIGFNVEWIARDGLGFALDVHSSEAESGAASPYGSNSVLGGVGYYRGTTAADYSSDFPVLIMETPNGQLDPSAMLTGGASFRNSYMKSEVEQLDLSGYWDMNDTMTLDFGVTGTEVNNRSAFSNVQYDNWGGIGSADDYPDELWQIRDVRSAFSNISGSNNPDLFNQMFVWNWDQMIPIAEASRGQTLAASPDFTTDRRTKEETTSAYLQYRWNFDIGNMNANLRAGLRYEETEVTSEALVPIAEQILWAGDNEYNIVFGDPDFTQLDGKYDYILPNLDFSLEVMDGVIVRGSYSETIGRPGWGDIQGGQTLNSLVRVDGGSGQQGDPGLLPLESKNYDLSFEWYYGNGSYASVGYFFKDVSNYVGITQITDTPFSLPHPGQGDWVAEAMAAGNSSAQDIRQYIFSTYGDDPAVNITGTDSNGRFTGTIAGRQGADPASTFDIQVPSNQQDAEIDGWELAVQHIFGDSGFGIIANYTIVDSDIQYDNFSIGDQFAIEGLSDSYNLVGFYDKNGWIARLAYNWRDAFLSGRFDGGGNPNPLYTDEYGQLDGIVSYTMENGVTLFVEGFNLTDEYSRVFGRSELQTHFVTQLGRRYGVGARWNF
ncbi:MAG: TonB-dependent receptor [Xanthomonadales bacterium]|jgi:TonB-dependent receptor|nr:TonB-dependent receptor [Xanthomonadales bacterium]